MALWGRLCNSRISSQEYHDERFNRHLPIFFERPFKKIGRWCLIRKKRRGFDIHHRSLKPHPLSFIKRKIITLLNAEEHRKSALMKIETCFGGMMQRRDFTAPHHCIQRMHSSKTKSVKCENDLQFEQALGIRASERAGLLFQDAFSCGSIDAVFFPPFPSLCSELARQGCFCCCSSRRGYEAWCTFFLARSVGAKRPGAFCRRNCYEEKLSGPRFLRPS